MITAKEIVHLLRTQRFPMDTEKILQAAIDRFLRSLKDGSLIVQREFHLNDKNIIDFLIDEHIGIEVKIKGSKRSIYKQVERYAAIEGIKELILITNNPMGFPEQINGKDCYVLNLGRAWL